VDGKLEEDNTMQNGGNKAVVHRFWEELFNRGNLGVADEILADEHVVHFPSLQWDEAGSDAMKTLVVLIRRLAPDIRATVEDSVAEGEKVVTSWKARGTIADGMRGVDSGDDEVMVSGVTIHHVFGDQIRETWWRFDVRIEDKSQRTLQEENREFVRRDMPESWPEDLFLGPICHIFLGCKRC
jgi:predicted ester cyclase